jgi:hypothetical protein
VGNTARNSGFQYAFVSVWLAFTDEITPLDVDGIKVADLKSEDGVSSSDVRVFPFKGTAIPVKFDFRSV